MKDAPGNPSSSWHVENFETTIPTVPTLSVDAATTDLSGNTFQDWYTTWFLPPYNLPIPKTQWTFVPFEFNKFNCEEDPMKEVVLDE